MNKKLVILAIIIVLASVLRLWHLNLNPPHLTGDEAALGYNAYSILTTGRDERGAFLPVIFQSFGDWKPGLYIYLTVPFVAILGLTEWAVRLPSALGGVAAVWLLGLVVSKLFKNPKLGILASLVLALNPWHIQFSRGAWEVNISLTLTLLGIYYFLGFVEGKKHSIYFSALFFALTLWAYQGAKLSTLIVVLALLISHFNQIKKLPKDVLAKALIMGLLVAAPVVWSVMAGKAGRLEIFSVFSYQRPPEVINTILKQDGDLLGSWEYSFYHSEALSLARGVLDRWFNHYSPRFLFFAGDWTNQRHQAPDMGMFLLADSIFLLLGFLSLAKTKDKRAVVFVLIWVILAPLPAALSRDIVHGVRSFNMVVPLAIINSLGLLWILEWLSKQRKTMRVPIYIVCCLLFVANYIYYLDQYWVHLPKHDAKYWQYGYKQAVLEISSNQESYDKIVFQQSYNQPYIFFLFYRAAASFAYQKYDPVYQPNPYGDVGLVTKIDNIEFRDATEGDLHKKGTLIIYDPEHPPFPGLSLKQSDGNYEEIKRPDGSTAFEFLSFR